MMKTASTVLVIFLVGYVALRIVFGITGGIIGVLLGLAWFALKILLVVGLIYWLLSVFAPDTAKKVKDSFRGQSL